MTVPDIELDKEGFLINLDSWTKEVAIEIAKNDNIELSTEHWIVINYLRDYFKKYQITPAMRIITKAIAQKIGDDKGNSIYLYFLFPQGPIKQGCRFAGLPKPSGCI